MTKYIGNFVSKVLIALVFLAALTGVVSHAQFDDDKVECGTTNTLTNISSLFQPGNFIPLVPEECGTTDGKTAAALSIELVPVMLVRGYGAISSIVIYLGMFYLIVAGIQYSSSGFDPGQKGKALNKIKTAAVSIVMVISAYTVVNTIVIILGVGEFSKMSVGDFFVN